MASKNMQAVDTSNNNVSQAEQQELDSKMVAVNDMCYYIDVKYGNIELILTFVEAFATGRRRRLSIGFSHIQKIIEILHAVVSYNNETLISSIKLNDTDDAGEKSANPSIIKTWTIVIFRRKRFYFDLKKNLDNRRFLKIATNVKGKKINVNLSLDSILPIVEILESYSDRFSVISANFSSEVKMSPKPAVTSDSVAATNKKKAQPKKKNIPADVSSSSAIVVLPSPQPTVLKFDKKEYRIEVVKTVSTTFLRITEYIGTRRKASLHIPINNAQEWQTAFNQFFAAIPHEVF